MSDELSKKDIGLENATFRSVLPHEPIPKRGLGYLHVQGALEPKTKHAPAETEEATTPHYWTLASLQQSLLNGLKKTSLSLKLTYPIEDLKILDAHCPPFTKFRLTYATPRQAWEIMMVWRQSKLTPQDLFSEQEQQHRHQQIQDVNLQVHFGTHPLQITLVTTDPLPPTQIPCWPRSNPPKFRRLLARPDEEGDSELRFLEQERANTRFVFLTGLLQSETLSTMSFWNKPNCVVEAIRMVVNGYDSSGWGVEVFVPHSRKQSIHSCHVGMRSASDAKLLIHALQGQVVTWIYGNESVNSRALFLDYASVTQRSIAQTQARVAGQADPPKNEPSRPECTSSTDHVRVPGLVVLPDFVSSREEDIILAMVTGPHAPWAPEQANKSKTGTVKRLVQHYGYVFDYETADVLRDRTQPGANCPPMPAIPTATGEEDTITEGAIVERFLQSGCGWEVLACIIERTRKYQFKTTENGNNLDFPHLNQLTINQYKPGEGIGSHVDTPSAFGDGLISISLNGGIVMEFRNVASHEKKLVYLPPRSLVLMSGPARFDWEHMIVTRRTDTVQGQVMPRTLRVSLTLRTALALDSKPLPLVDSCKFPPTWGDDGNSLTVDRRHALTTPATERDHVQAVYDAIATQWHHTRGKRGVLWPGATQFLQRLPRGSIIADVGCGDGKYFPAIWDAGSFVIGSDICLPLLQTCMDQGNQQDGNDSDFENTKAPDACKIRSQSRLLQNRPAVVVADCMSVPLKSRSCDAAICIAVMHHLSTEERRLRCIEELVRIVKVGGSINIQAWAMEQQETSKRQFAAPDVFVPFNAQPKYLDKVIARPNEALLAPVRSCQSKSVAQEFSEAYKNADFDEKKGLVVFQRYCHLYRKGELEDLVARIPGAKLVESGYESGNHFVILQVSH